jgi:hypothetical protein
LLQDQPEWKVPEKDHDQLVKDGWDNKTLASACPDSASMA